MNIYDKIKRLKLSMIPVSLKVENLSRKNLMIGKIETNKALTFIMTLVIGSCYLTSNLYCIDILSQTPSVFIVKQKSM